MTDERMKDLKDVIEHMINDAFARINYAYQHNKEPKAGERISKGYNDVKHQTFTRLVFPRYSKEETNVKNEKIDAVTGETRISEQELRFAFVEAFNAYYCKENDNQKNNTYDLYYSIETPTRRRYTGFSKGEPDVIKEKESGGRSAEFDLVIFNRENNRLERVCLIEFKANNADRTDHKKDLLKLKTEGDGVLRYFIEVVKAYSERDTDNSKKSEISSQEDKKNKTTIESLQEKFKWHNDDRETIIKCYALEGKSVRNKKEEDKIGEDISNKFN